MAKPITWRNVNVQQTSGGLMSAAISGFNSGGAALRDYADFLGSEAERKATAAGIDQALATGAVPADLSDRADRGAILDALKADADVDNVEASTSLLGLEAEDQRFQNAMNPQREARDVLAFEDELETNRVGREADQSAIDLRKSQQRLTQEALESERRADLVDQKIADFQRDFLQERLEFYAGNANAQEYAQRDLSQRMAQGLGPGGDLREALDISEADWRKSATGQQHIQRMNTALTSTGAAKREAGMNADGLSDQELGERIEGFRSMGAKDWTQHIGWGPDGRETFMANPVPLDSQEINRIIAGQFSSDTRKSPEARKMESTIAGNLQGFDRTYARQLMKTAKERAGGNYEKYLAELNDAIGAVYSAFEQPATREALINKATKKGLSPSELLALNYSEGHQTPSDVFSSPLLGWAEQRVTEVPASLRGPVIPAYGPGSGGFSPVPLQTSQP